MNVKISASITFWPRGNRDGFVFVWANSEIVHCQRIQIADYFTDDMAHKIIADEVEAKKKMLVALGHAPLVKTDLQVSDYRAEVAA